jgi:hypothetical protein
MKKAAPAAEAVPAEPAAATPLPAMGGSYTRNPDGSLSRESAGIPAAETPAEEA